MIITCANRDQDMVKLVGGWRGIGFRKQYCITIIITIIGLQQGCTYSISLEEVTIDPCSQNNLKWRSLIMAM